MNSEIFNQELIEKFTIEYEKAVSICSDDEKEMLQVRSDNDLNIFLKSLNNFMEWQAVPNSSKSNIKQCFSERPGFGNKIGFIDIGIIFKKGKVGVLFFEGGLAIKTLTEKQEFSLPYSILCKSLITENNTFLSEYKFTVQNGLINFIQASPTIKKILNEIRKCLLYTNKDARALFYYIYCELLKQLKNSIEQENIDSAQNDMNLLSSFIASNTDSGYKELYRIESILYMMQKDFDSALSQIQGFDDQEWLEYVNSIKYEHNYAESQMHFKSSLDADAVGDSDLALNEIKNALNILSTDEYWDKYVDLIIKYACPDNQYLFDELQRVMNVKEDTVNTQGVVLEKRKNELNELSDKYEKWIAELNQKMINAVINNDIEFIKENSQLYNLRNEFGMTPLMYAVICRNHKAIDLIINNCNNSNDINVLGMNYLDLAYLVCPEYSQYDMYYSKYNQRFCNLQAEYDKKIKSLERSVKLARFNENLGNASLRSASRNIDKVNFDTVIKVANMTDNMRNRQDEIYQEMERSETDFMHRRNELFNNTIRFFWNQICKYYTMDPIIPERKNENDIMMLAEDPLFSETFNAQKNNFISDYIKSNLTEKGEFETSVQYEERKKQVMSEGEDKFMKDAPLLLMSLQEENILFLEEESKKSALAKTIVPLMFNGKVKLGKYDADNEKFKIFWDGFAETKVCSEISIPLSVASLFKDMYIENGFDLKVRNIDFQVVSENNAGRALLNAECFVVYDGVEYYFEIKQFVNLNID